MLKKVLWMFPISVGSVAGFVVYEVSMARHTPPLDRVRSRGDRRVIIAMKSAKYRKLRGSGRPPESPRG